MAATGSPLWSTSFAPATRYAWSSSTGLTVLGTVAEMELAQLRRFDSV
jgi:hypothetical protein